MRQGERIELRAALALPIVFGFFAFVFGARTVLPMPAGGHIALGVATLFFVGFAILLGRRRLIVDDSGITAKGVFGPRRDFAPFALGTGKLVHAKKGAIALPDIEKISVGGGRLIIKKASGCPGSAST